MTAIHPLYSLAGLFVGILVGMTGVGGGSLMTPILVLLFGFHPAVAVGTDLLYAAVTKSVGSAVHGWRRSVEWRIVGRLAAGSLPAACLSLLVLSHMGRPSAATAHLITVALGVALLATGLSLVFRRQILAWSSAHRVDRGEVRTTISTIALGMVIGVAVALTSVGAGAIGATVLLALYPRLSISRIAGTDIAHAVPLALVSGIGHWWMGNVDVSLLASLLLGSVPGIVIGSLVASRVDEGRLRLILAVTLIIVGVQLIL
ncbi:sulfite exporter TauE/SafE family protein [Sphingomonas colocasiae]|uniref:Probable membrane transporter protein n=1 Tax=Sphingomonas colocasiae TaxID=1848973 RepID=A0ABS7PYN2_9SPHN|nr:sulfite exporter TauE/SafE family protein [Sphingomonas colocasiae]MBY8826216.1 sulfite exporter TauE/SafE family protein [Sphingomonas colocasiae]